MFPSPDRIATMAAQQTSTPSKIPFQPPVARAGNPYRNQWREPPPFPPSWQLAGTGYRPQWYRPQWYPPHPKLNPPTSHQVNYPDGCSARQVNYPDGCSARQVTYPDGWNAPLPIGIPIMTGTLAILTNIRGNWFDGNIPLHPRILARQ